MFQLLVDGEQSIFDDSSCASSTLLITVQPPFPPLRAAVAVVLVDYIRRTVLRITHEYFTSTIRCAKH